MSVPRFILRNTIRMLRLPWRCEKALSNHLIWHRRGRTVRSCRQDPWVAVRKRVWPKLTPSYRAKPSSTVTSVAWPAIRGRIWKSTSSGTKRQTLAGQTPTPIPSSPFPSQKAKSKRRRARTAWKCQTRKKTKCPRAKSRSKVFARVSQGATHFLLTFSCKFFFVLWFWSSFKLLFIFSQNSTNVLKSCLNGSNKRYFISSLTMCRRSPRKIFSKFVSKNILSGRKNFQCYRRLPVFNTTILCSALSYLFRPLCNTLCKRANIYVYADPFNRSLYFNWKHFFNEAWSSFVIKTFSETKQSH